MMMQVTYNAISQSIKLVDIHAKFKVLDRYLLTSSPPCEEVFHRIKEEKIDIVYHSKRKFTITELIHSPPQKGRITIRGGNGSGKSTLMNYIKHSNNESIYIPCYHHLYFSSTKDKNLSTGELMKNILMELKHLQNGSILLLDEWDANLDQEAITELDEMIQMMSETSLIIEVRHR